MHMHKTNKAGNLCANQSEWNDWRWQMRNRIRSVDKLRQLLSGVQNHSAISKVSARFPMSLTPYYAALIKECSTNDPIYSMSVPQLQELVYPAELSQDPLKENEATPLKGLIRRYANRALIMATSQCAVYCRHCTRKHIAGQKETPLSRLQLSRICDYLQSHPEINEAIISGGDPLTLPDKEITSILAAVRQIKSIDIIRIGTRTPVVLPMRITATLTRILRSYHPVYINTHFNHPVEVTASAADACQKLADAGIPLGNQTVLLRGINDSTAVLAELFSHLVKCRVRPYYLFQCDQVSGIGHFQTPICRGLRIMQELRHCLSGLAIPAYVVDTPGISGKLPLSGGHIIEADEKHTIMKDAEGKLITIYHRDVESCN